MPFDGQARWQLDIMAADKTAQAFGSVDRRLKSLEAGVMGLGRTMAGGIGQTVAFGQRLQALAVGYGVVTVAQKAFQAGLRIGDLGEQAEQLGVTTDQLQAYRLMAAQAGVTNEQLDGSLLKLQRAMGAANDGSDEMIARFEKLGVKILDSNKNLRPVSDILPEVARGMLRVGSDTERTAMMTELFGRSGARLKTMLEEWAQGNERLVSSAKNQNAVAGPDAIRAWDNLGDALKVAEQRYDTMVGTFGKPVALVGLRAINAQLHNINSAMNGIKAAWSWLTSQAPLEQQVDKANAEIAAFIERGYESNNPVLKDLIAKRDALLEQLKTQPVATMPTITVTGTSGGDSNPVGDKSKAAGAKLDDRLKELQNERAALEKALAAFDKRGLETVDEIDRRLDTQVKRDKRIYDVLKDVPPNSPLAQQLVQEATAVSQLNTRLDERKRLLNEAEQVVRQYGDGSLVAARATDQLNAMLKAGVIDAGTYERALKATKQAADDQARAARGAAGGLGGFMAGVEQGGADMERANSAFELGRATVQEFGSVFSNVNEGLRQGKDLWQSLGDVALNALNRIADKLISMAIADLFSAAFPGGGGGGGGMGAGGIMNLFGGGGMGGTSGGMMDGIMSLFNFFPTFAEGGDYQAGVPRIVGEKGWELDIPRQPGTVLNQRQLAGMLGGNRGGRESGGGGSPIVINQSVQVGSVVSQAQFERDLARMKRETTEAAVFAVREQRRNSSTYRRAFRG